ncbi:MAG: methyl-accepting chemotaxis protein [Thermodesulfobacteriota bacterium]
MGIGFGTVLVLLGLVLALSVAGISSIVGTAGGVVAGSQLDTELGNRFLDHLRWRDKVLAVLSEGTAASFEVEKDPRHCAFGQWYYGAGRQEAQALVPALAPLLAEMEASHSALHQSVVDMEALYRPADRLLPTTLATIQNAHLRWAAAVRDALVEKRSSLGVELDPTRCGLGQWLAASGSRQAYAAASPAFRQAFDALVAAHERLHASGRAIEGKMAFEAATAAEKDLQAAQAQLHLADSEVFSSITSVMEEYINPRRDAAQSSGDLARIRHWNDLDMFTNEEVLQGFLMASLLLGRLQTAGDSSAVWDGFQEQCRQLAAGLAHWQQLVQGDPTLEALAGRVTTTIDGWQAAADAFWRALQEERQAAATIAEAVRIHDEETRPLLREVLGQLDAMKSEAVSALEGYERARDIFKTETAPALAAVSELFTRLRATVRESIGTDTAILAAAERAQARVLAAGGLALTAGLVAAWLITQGLTRLLSRVSAGMHQGATQVRQQAQQQAGAGQSLAEGVAEQAASLEETSAAVEEMAAMSQQNADNASLANGVMQEVSGVVRQADAVTRDLTQAMAAIAASSSDTAKIIRAIDDIAFQTNLLALNAAVEAARAGESGAGFAVVADEVRGLAGRAAEAARHTGTLIESTMDKVRAGTALADRTNQAFASLAASAGKVEALLAEIAAASRDQAKGVEEISTVVSRMDQVVQQTAANAEESAAAASELHRLAEGMQGEMATLMLLTTGQAAATDTPPGSVPGRLTLPR